MRIGNCWFKLKDSISILATTSNFLLQTKTVQFVHRRKMVWPTIYDSARCQEV